MHITPYDPSRKEEWDSFVRRSNNGTVFHEQQFLEYHAPGKFPFHHLMFFEGETLHAVLPGGIKNDVFESPIGSSYGSFVTGDITANDALNVVDAFLAYAREKGIKKNILTPAPVIYQKKLSQNLDFALLYRGFSYDRHYISHAIELDCPDPLIGFQRTARNNIHKWQRQRNIDVMESDDIDQFYPILVENKKKFNTTPTHSLEDLRSLEKLLPGMQKLFLAYHNGTPIAGTLLFLANPRVAITFYTMLRYEYKELRPIYPVQYEAITWATKNGYRWVDLGVSQDTSDDNPMTPALSLIQFKEWFNSRGILRSTMSLEL